MSVPFITSTHMISSLGFGIEAHREALSENRSGITYRDYEQGKLAVSQIDDTELSSQCRAEALPDSFSRLESLMVLTVQRTLRAKSIEISPSTPFFISTTKGNIDQIDDYTAGKVNSLHITESARKIRSYFGLDRDPVVVCNACTSGVMAIIMAARMICQGLIDDAIVCGADVLSEFTLRGFGALHAMDSEKCKPYDKSRRGINLGEGAACIYLSGDPGSIPIEILGGAITNDANHISGPSRTGEGLQLAIRRAMEESGDRVPQYINAHGTATMYNDEMEAQAFHRVGLAQLPVNSMKGYWGHTLGAAGVLETVGTVISMENNELYKSAGYNENGLSQELNILRENENLSLNCCLKTSSGFGGSNAALILNKP